MKRIASITATTLALIIGGYLIVRALIEPFVIDLSDPATYQDDWGGPGLLGVLAAHCGPGLVAALIIATVVLLRRRASRRQADTGRA